MRLFRVKNEYISVNSINTFIFIFVRMKAFLLKGAVTFGILSELLVNFCNVPLRTELNARECCAWSCVV